MLWAEVHGVCSVGKRPTPVQLVKVQSSIDQVVLLSMTGKGHGQGQVQGQGPPVGGVTNVLCELHDPTIHQLFQADRLQT